MRSHGPAACRVALLLLALAPLAPLAQSLDPAFAAPTFWQRFTEYTASAGPYRSFPDGKGNVYLTGNGGLDVFNGIRTGEPILIREDGALAGTFQTQLGGCFAGCVQPDGKFVVSFYDYSCDTVVRLLANGERDPDFEPIGFTQGVRHLAAAPDGKVLVVVWGNPHVPANPRALATPLPTIVRLLPNGRLDTSFRRTEFPANSMLYAAPVFDASGRIYVGGNFTQVNGVQKSHLARLLPDGEVDPSFAGFATAPAGLEVTVRSLNLQSTGKVLVTGDLRKTGSTIEKYAAFRFDSQGVFDSSFTSAKLPELGLADYARDMVMQGDKFVLVSQWLRRFNADGTPDYGFRAVTLPRTAFWVSRLSDGRLMVPSSSAAPGLAVFSADGEPDSSFKTGEFGYAIAVNQLLQAGSGDLLVAGPWNRVDMRPQLGTAMLRSTDGRAPLPQPDLISMAPITQTFALSGPIMQIAPGPTNTLWFLTRTTDAGRDESLFLGRLALSPPGMDAGMPVRNLFADLSLLHVTDIHSLPDGRLLAFGNSPQAPLTGRFMTRFNAAGKTETFKCLPDDVAAQLGQVSRDSLGNLLSIGIGSVKPLTRPGSNTLYAALTPLNGTTRLARFNSQGAYDPSFVSPSTPAQQPVAIITVVFDPSRNQFVQVYAFVMASQPFTEAVELPDGKVVVCGKFTALDGVPMAGIARLTPVGALDQSFSAVQVTNRANPLVEATIDSVAADRSGRIYLAGRFDTVNGAAAPGLARLLADGKVDTGFHSPLEFQPWNGVPSKMLVSGDDLYLSGAYEHGGKRPSVWRLSLRDPFKLTIASEFPGQARLEIPADPVYPVVLQASENLASWVNIFTNPASGSPAQFVDPALLPQRFYRLLKN